MTGEEQVLAQLREVVSRALEERRELVAFTRLEAMEMDRRARELERAALERVRALLPPSPAAEPLYQIKTRLARMDETLEALRQRQDIAERSRALEYDDITWRAFEDVSWMLGVA